MTKAATDWIAYLEAEPHCEPNLSIAATLREHAAAIAKLELDVRRAHALLAGLDGGSCHCTLCEAHSGVSP